MSPTVSIPTSLLEAVARWALPDTGERRHLSQIAFRASEMVATDGVRIVRVPFGLAGLTCGLRRCDALAAVAAQDALLPRCTPRERRVIRIHRPSPGVLVLLPGLGTHPAMRVAEVADAFPSYDEVFTAIGAGARPATAPDGIAFNPEYLAAIQEVAEALEPNAGQRAVTVARWGGLLDPTLFTGPAGSQFVIMPMTR